MFYEYPSKKMDRTFIKLHNAMSKIIDYLSGKVTNWDTLKERKIAGLLAHLTGLHGVRHRCIFPICLAITTAAKFWDGVRNDWYEVAEIKTNYVME